MDMASLVEIKKNPRIPDIVPGDTVKVSARIVEGGKERIQVLQGVIIKVRRGGAGASFTVRHVAYGIGVERTFPLYSPLVEKVEVVRHGKVRRAKLYYLRGLSGKAARRKIKRVDRKARKIGEEVLAPEPEEIIEPALERERQRQQPWSRSQFRMSRFWNRNRKPLLRGKRKRRWGSRYQKKCRNRKRSLRQSQLGKRNRYRHQPRRERLFRRNRLGNRSRKSSLRRSRQRHRFWRRNSQRKQSWSMKKTVSKRRKRLNHSQQ